VKVNGVISVGRIYCDLNFSGFPAMPVLGREVFADEVSLHAGGGAFITASYLAALGRTSRVMGVIPSQPFASIIQHEAQENGVALVYCAELTDTAPQLTVAMATDTERAFLTCRSGPGLPDDYADAFIHIATSADLGHMHIGELATLLEYPDLIEHARAARLTISLDCGWDEACFANPLVPELLRQVDVFLPNAAEMGQLLANEILQSHAPLTVVKQGDAGATAYSANRQVSDSGVAQKVVDTIGAGDAFNAGFIAAWLDAQSLQQCLSLGNACGSIAVARRGGASKLPDLKHLTGSSVILPAETDMRHHYQ